MRILLTTASLVMAFSMALCAADIDGVWKTSYKAPDGSVSQSTFHLKSVGGKLTGKIVGSGGELVIKDGVVKGDDVSFSVIRKVGDRDVPLKYVGKVAGDELKLKLTVAKEQYDIDAKRLSR